MPGPVKMTFMERLVMVAVFGLALGLVGCGSEAAPKAKPDGGSGGAGGDGGAGGETRTGGQGAGGGWGGGGGLGAGGASANGGHDTSRAGAGAGGGAGTGGASGHGGAETSAGGASFGGAPGEGGVSGHGGGAVGGAADVVIVRGDPTRTFATGTFEARGFGAAYEGHVVIVRVGMPNRAPERLGQGQTRFHDGAFQLPFPMGIETSLYKAKLLFIDVDGDGICAPATDRVYQDHAFIDDDASFVLQGSVPAATGTTEHPMLEATGDAATQVCATMNGPWPDK